MFENARREVSRFDGVADLCLCAAARTMRRHSGPANYPLRVTGYAQNRPFLIDTLAIRIPRISLKTQGDTLV